MSKLQFMTLDNLTVFKSYLDSETASRIETAVSSSIKTVSVSADGYTIYLYKKENPTTEADAAFVINIPKTSIDGKIDKIINGTAGNLPLISENGNLVDSNKSISDFATKEQGKKADSAVQTVSSGSENGTINVDGTDVKVTGLQSAAYKNADMFETKEHASSKYTSIENNVSVIQQDVTDLQTDMGSVHREIDLMNNETTGILSKAKKYTDEKIVELSLGDFASTEIVMAELAKKADKATTYTKAEIDSMNESTELEIQAVSDYIGTIPSSSNAHDVISYIDQKTANPYDDTEVRRAIQANTQAISVLNGNSEGSVNKKVADAIASIVADAPESLDTLKEISDWITTHASSAAEMNSNIKTNTDEIAKVKRLVGEIPETSTSTTVIDFITEAIEEITQNVDACTKSEEFNKAVARITENEKNISTLQSKTNRLDNSVGVLEDSVESISEKIGTLPPNTEQTTVVGYINESVKNISDEVATTVLKLDSVSSDLKTANNEIKTLTDKVATNKNSIDQLNTNVGTNTQNIADLTEYVGQLPEDALETDVVSYIDSQVAHAINEATYDDTALKASVNENTQSIQAINNPATGILAVAKNDSTIKMGAALESAKDYTDTLANGIVANNTAGVTANADSIRALKRLVGDGFEPIPTSYIEALFNKQN